MRSVTKRHQTFKTRSESKWAECGFYYCKFSNMYCCAYCSARLDLLPMGECMWNVHRLLNASCPLLIKKLNLLEISDSNACHICMEIRKECVTLPCKHLCMCQRCTALVTQCPLCRVKIESVLKIFP
jgi:hypothetical protein